MNQKNLGPLTQKLLDGLDTREDLERDARLLLLRMRFALGDAGAQKLWKAVGKAPPGRPKGSKGYDRSVLLDIFDELWRSQGSRETERPAVIRKVAELADSRHPKRFGATADGIEKGLARDIKERKADAERRQKNAVLARVLMADTPTDKN